jgi:hypothetical protein
MISTFGCEKEYSSVFDPVQNIPPVIKNVRAPDTLIVPGADTLKIVLSVDVSDANGREDVLSVFFNTFKPDGSPSSGNPFQMFDDGNVVANGDLVKDDGTFSRIIILPPGTTKGKYRFDFQAIDKSDESSNIISHFMVLK